MSNPVSSSAPTAQPTQVNGDAPRHNGDSLHGNGETSLVNGTGGGTSMVDVTCGPLLNYRYMTGSNDKPVWHGSVLIVAKPGATVQPRLRYREAPVGVLPQSDHATANGVSNGAHSATNGIAPEHSHADSSTSTNATTSNAVAGGGASSEWRTAEVMKLFSDPRKTFWRFDLTLPLGPREVRWEYELLETHFASGSSSSRTPSFVVPATSESMRIMFHSCNGFSVGTDEDDWSGCVLWSDVLRMHAQKPIHVMLGGGDQIYNDGVRVDGPLRKWTEIGNPVKRRDYPFDEALRAECDAYYFENYVRWYSTEPFATANAQIPQINIWDDHGKGSEC